MTNNLSKQITPNCIPKPHGGKLVNRINESKFDTNDMYSIDINDDLRNDIENIADGIFSPLDGFVCKEDFYSILTNGRLKNDVPWTIPLLLDVKNSIAQKAKDSKEISLRNNGEHFATLYFDEYFTFDKKEMVNLLYQTEDPAHPGVLKTFNMNDTLIAGKIELNKRISHSKLGTYRSIPSTTRSEIANKKWKTIVGFQTRNVPHIAHEMLQKAALNIFDALFINPLIGKKKPGDFQDNVILQSYESLIKNYYPSERVMFVTLHTEMRYAGPKEAIHHAIMRKNFGCSHFIVGRDHAGVGDFYDPFAAHKIFNDYPDLEIQPIFFPAFYYCKRCLGYANERNCPHDKQFREELSGTRMRKMVSSGEVPGKHLLRPEIAEIILSNKNPFVK
ncbi:MAG: sulfate adenylyltransferase [Nitrososphaeraceae archaeon]